MKKTLIAAALALGMFTSSCLGPDNLYGSIKNWNVEVSEQDWLNEGIFLAFWVVPIYPFALLGDVVIFNTWEYWAGENPIKSPGEFKGFTREK